MNDQSREDTVVQSNGTAFVHSTVQKNGYENTYGLLLDSTSGIALHMESSNVNDVHQVQNPANPSLSIAYGSIVEFNDTDGNGAFDPGQDTIVQSINLETRNYASPEIRAILSQDGKQGWQLVSRTLDHLFTVSTETFSQTAQVNDTYIPPTSTRIVITINTSQIQLRNPAHRLALETVVMSRLPFEGAPVPSGSSLTIKSGEIRQFFSWNPTSTVDSHQAQVMMSAQQINNKIAVNLSYPTGGSIIHNMLLGVVFGTTPLLTASLLIGASIAALVLFGFLFFVGRRQYSRAVYGRL